MYSFPIRIHLFVAIVSFVLLLGVTLGIFHYQKITTLIIEDAEVTFDQVAKDMFEKAIRDLAKQYSGFDDAQLDAVKAAPAGMV